MGTRIGKVYLVGAGPGATDLITVRGKTLIEQCDALVYDYLAGEGLLDWVSSDCEKICVGKRRGLHSMPQAEIQVILKDLAYAGKNVVRLKGGDPMLFGRGGEEIRFLKEQNIEWEVVPGVTAALATASRLGMSLTDRNYSSGVLFLTGHEDPSKGEVSVDWGLCAKMGVTLCLYMSMHPLAAICETLLENGAPEDTPVAIVQWATTEKEQRCFGTISNILANVEASGIGAPAIVIIGKVTESMQ